jgi:hypothetical protein
VWNRWNYLAQAVGYDYEKDVETLKERLHCDMWLVEDKVKNLIEELYLYILIDSLLKRRPFEQFYQETLDQMTNEALNCPLFQHTFFDAVDGLSLGCIDERPDFDKKYDRVMNRKLLNYELKFTLRYVCPDYETYYDSKNDWYAEYFVRPLHVSPEYIRPEFYPKKSAEGKKEKIEIILVPEYVKLTYNRRTALCSPLTVKTNIISLMTNSQTADALPSQMCKGSNILMNHVWFIHSLQTKRTQQANLN